MPVRGFARWKPAGEDNEVSTVSVYVCASAAKFAMKEERVSVIAHPLDEQREMLAIQQVLGHGAASVQHS